MNSTDIEYVLHCIKNASELINQSESEKAKGLLLSAELLLSEKLTSDNSDYAKCLQRFCDLLDDDDCFDWHGDISGFIEKYKKHFA